MLKKSIIFIFTVFFTVASFCQELIKDGETSVLVKNDYVFGGSIQSAGILAINYRRGYQETVNLKKLWEIELANLQHPKEFSDPRFPNFIFKPGKINTVWTLRASYGVQRELTEKLFSGVSVNWLYLGGVSFALAKPIFVSVNHSHTHTASQAHDEVTEEYNPTEHSIGDIQSKEGFFTGIDKGKFHPGVFLKTGLNFEYSQYKKNIKAVEVGVSGDYYLKEIPIMSSISGDNSNLYVAFYVNFLFGKKW